MEQKHTAFFGDELYSNLSFYIGHNLLHNAVFRSRLQRKQDD